MQPISEANIVARGGQVLNDVLSTLHLEISELADREDDSDFRVDAFWNVRRSSPGSPGHVATLLVEAKRSFSPATMENLRRQLAPERVQRMAALPVIVAPWLSPRSRAVIQEAGWGYVDLTGNVLIRSEHTPLYILHAGADADPNPREPGDVLLRGSQVNALIRLLVDVEPPYRLKDLSAAAGLSNGYVSKVLSSLADKGLIVRDSSGPVEQVFWQDLLRAYAAEYNLFRTNRSATFLARRGPRQLLEELEGNDKVVITGSFAAEKVRSVAAPAQLAVYVPSIETYAQKLDVYEAQSGANVVLLEARSPSQLARTRLVDGLRHTGFSQLAVDLLSGNGRLPEEGEAVLEWMADTPDWRLPHLSAGRK